jgi:hypothetical protein
MIHKSRIVPGLSQFIDANVLSHYPPTSMKRIICAGGIAIYLSNGESMVDSLLSHPLISGLGVVNSDGMVNIELLRDVLKKEITKAGYMRVSLPLMGDVDFTADDVDSLYNYIVGGQNQVVSTQTPQHRYQEVY